MTTWHEHALRELRLTARIADSPQHTSRSADGREHGLRFMATDRLRELVDAGQVDPIAMHPGQAAERWSLGIIGGAPLAVHLRRKDGRPLRWRSARMPEPDLGPDADSDDAGFAILGAPGGVVVAWGGDGRGLLFRWDDQGELDHVALEDVQPERLDLAPLALLTDPRPRLAPLVLTEALRSQVEAAAARPGLGPALAVGLVLHLADPGRACGVDQALAAALAGGPDPLEQLALAWLGELDDAQRETLLDLADAAVTVLQGAVDALLAAPDAAGSRWRHDLARVVKTRDDLEALARLLRLGGLAGDLDTALLDVDHRLAPFFRDLPETVYSEDPRLVLAVAIWPDAWWLQVLTCPRS